MTDEAVSPLRRRMIEDMTIRKFAPKTQHDYVQRIKNFAAFLGRSPHTASFEDVRRYQLHLAASGVGVPTINQTVSTLRFFFKGHAEAPRDRRAHPCHSRASQAAGGAERGGSGAAARCRAGSEVQGGAERAPRPPQSQLFLLASAPISFKPGRLPVLRRQGETH
jgi:integrase-like protein